jgi:hypothetical protein
MHILTTCLSCPGNSSSAAGSTAQSSCSCNVGYTGASSGPCVFFVAGTYKAVTGSAACTDCGAGKYLGTEGATAVSTSINCLVGQYSSTAISVDFSTCLSCPGNSSSAADSTSCLCNVGYTVASGGPGIDGGTCVACAVCTYKGIAGTDECQTCLTSMTTATEQCVNDQFVCRKGFFGVFSQNMLSSNIRVLLTGMWNILVASTAVFGWSTSGVKPIFFAQGGYYNNVFLPSSKMLSSCTQHVMLA